MTIHIIAHLQHRFDVVTEAYGAKAMDKLRALMLWLETIHNTTRRQAVKFIAGKLHLISFKLFQFIFERVFNARNRLILAIKRQQL